MRRSVAVAVALYAGQARAQPADPYAPAPQQAPAKPGDDPVLGEQVAESLVERAQELLDAKVYLDAKQLAVEAMVRSPRGTAAEHAKLIIHTVNVQLGIAEDNPLTPPSGKVDLTPIQDPTLKPIEQPVVIPPAVEGNSGNGQVATMVHTGLYAGLLGTTIGALFSRDDPAAPAVPIGIAAGVAGAIYLPRLVDRLHWSEAKIRTVGSASVWGGVMGGFIADISTGHTTGREVLVGATIGSTASLLGGVLYAQYARPLTRGDIALVDTFAGMGALGGLTVGMLMQPAQGEAYSLNAVLGAGAGIVTALIAAPQTNTTQRRMLRVAGLALAGGALPFLLYAGIHDPTTNADERITGLLSSAGLLGGAYLGFRLTEHMDEGLDTLDGKPPKPPEDEPPPAILGRSSDGSWNVNGVGISPLSPALAPQHGMAFGLVSGRF